MYSWYKVNKEVPSRNQRRKVKPWCKNNEGNSSKSKPQTLLESLFLKYLLRIIHTQKCLNDIPILIYTYHSHSSFIYSSHKLILNHIQSKLFVTHLIWGGLPGLQTIFTRNHSCMSKKSKKLSSTQEVLIR